MVSFYRFMPRPLDSSIDIEWWKLQFELPTINFAGVNWRHFRAALYGHRII